ncbi:MAG: OmpA family protein, partial [Polyangiaceae bacterium]|nr:OmpA family protein [Polyangiaceae bacterium]
MGRKLAASLVAVLIVAPIPGCTIHTQSGPPPADPVSAPPPEPPPAATPTPEPAEVNVPSKVKQEGNKLKMPGAIVFEFGKATLLPESEPVLEELKAYLVAKPRISLVRIEGHTDNIGQAPANLKLSGDRALTVRQWLVGRG